MLQILRLATPQKSHPDKTPTDPQIEMEYLDKDLISEQVSDFGFGHQKCPFWEKPLSLVFLTSEKSLQVPKTKILDLFWNQVCDGVTW